MDIGNSFQKATDAFFGFLPNLLGFLVILVIGFIVAKIVAGMVRKVLQKLGIDRHLHESDANKLRREGVAGREPVQRHRPGACSGSSSSFFLFSAIGALKIPALTTFMNQVLAYLPNVIVAIIIFVRRSRHRRRRGRRRSPGSWATPPPARSSQRSCPRSSWSSRCS